MKRFNKYFGGEYMKYWYVAFIVTIAIMALNMISAKNVREFEITVFDKNGQVIEKKVYHKNELRIIEKIRQPKAVMPLKKF
jgi:hypothetical protein